jgi:peptide/nickel transport system substrate-binding protein
VATVALLAEWSCSPEPTCTGDWCGTAVILTVPEPGVLFPPTAQTDVEIGISDLLFLKLADVGPSLNTADDNTFAPQLAESWRFIDPLTIEFTLHPEARWQDGVPVTAADVEFTFDVYRDSAVGAIALARLHRITNVTATDERTVVVRFSQPYAEQFFDAVYHTRIIPKHLLDSVPRERLTSHPFGREPIGNGPYRFVRWNVGESVELAADSTFFLGRPGIRRIVWQASGDPATGFTRLLADEADVMDNLGSPTNVQRARDADHLRVVEYRSSAYAYVSFNFWDPDDLSTPHPLFGDRDVRRALTMALDREAIVRAVFGDLAAVPPGPISQALWVWRDDLAQLPFDSTEARRLFASRGWVDSDGDGVLDREGRPFEFELLVPNSSTPRLRASQIMQDQLRRIGVAVRIAEMDFIPFVDAGPTRQWDAWFGAYGNEISPASIHEAWSTSAFQAWNHGRYSNPAFDDVVRSAMNALDLPAAEQLWHRALNIIVNDAPAIWVYSPVGTTGVHARFENVTVRPDQWYSSIWQWRVPASRQHDRDRYAN